MILAARRLLTHEHDLSPAWVEVENGVVAGLGGGTPPHPVDVVLDGTVVPGLVDTHVHGGGGRSFDEGGEAAEAVVAAHLAAGTTTMLASLVTLEGGELARVVGELSPLVDHKRLAGLHLEGPWLSPAHRGAHDPALLQHPTPERVEALLSLADGRLRMVTLAAELPGGLDAVRRLRAAGVVVALGHTDATYDVTREALDAGASVGTHLFNAMRPLQHREPGPVTALLEHPDAVVELIADGVHVHPAVLGLAARAKPRRVTLVTDAMAAAAAADGDYRLGGLAVSVREGRARLADGTIAGSTLTMAQALRYAVTTAGLALPDAVRAATTTPARTLGLERAGDLRPGGPADLVVLDDDLAVARVMKLGRWVA